MSVLLFYFDFGGRKTKPIKANQSQLPGFGRKSEAQSASNEMRYDSYVVMLSEAKHLGSERTKEILHCATLRSE
jgi:hypothetical protein